MSHNSIYRTGDSPIATNPEIQISEIIALISRHPEGLARGEIVQGLNKSIKIKTLQRRLASLVQDGRIGRKGQGRGTRYFPLVSQGRPATPLQKVTGHLRDISPAVFGTKSLQKLQFLADPPYLREKVSYNRRFLEDYAPNQTSYLPLELRRELYEEGKRFDGQLAAGTYAQQISQRLLIDLSYNSSRLEGNTYSRLDTQRLVEEGLSSEGKVREEAVMISNHKETILFLVENVNDFELSGMVIRNIHHLLAQDLLSDPASLGAIRKMTVHVSHSAYQPLANPHQLGEYFELIALKAEAIDDAFEQSFFLLAHLSYLQAFEDVNKRTARLACNVPFFRHNLCPLSFVDVAQTDYVAAILALYEQNEIEPLVDLFAWAYRQSSRMYGAVKDSLGDIDPHRIKYREQRKLIMGRIVREKLHGAAALDEIRQFCETNAIDETEKFIAMTVTELENLHDGMIWSIRVSAEQLKAWLNARPRT